jgi:hypothetical protein
MSAAALVSRLDLLPPPWEGGYQTPVLRLNGRLDAGSVSAFRLRMRELVLLERGRGLSLAQTALDELAYERRGGLNRWRLTKHC